MCVQNNQSFLKSKILDHAKVKVLESGWLDDIPETCSVQAGLDKSIGRILFPAGTVDIIGFFLYSLDYQMLESYKLYDSSNLRTHEKIKLCLSIIFKLMLENKILFRATFKKLLSTSCYLTGIRYLWRTVDLIWSEAGVDTSTDFNFYTKRSLLAGIYTSIALKLLYSRNEQDVDALIDRGIELSSVIKNFKAKFFFS
ncbi:COQ9 superfamily protein [Candidatus Cyrtobacter comes]|uniref:COQ9 superfamily protein n=1 Tax=Candidatus Cyrtobacter comes TaxID=675776 RepID=A0ABU5L7J3_9RICK|nr:COQ9 family protein [Candidatus Cyrtobacter comes]MDZ5762106.1 COQ9 superfamily protein [Candidatus Cyrtobacter comes]